MRSDQLHLCLALAARKSTRFQALVLTSAWGTQLAVTNGMKTMSPWMPEAADESTMLEVVRQMLDLGIPIDRGAGGGFRISVDPDPAIDTRTPDAKLIPARHRGPGQRLGGEHELRSPAATDVTSVSNALQ